MDISCGAHVVEDILLQLRHRLQAVRDVLILLNISNDFCSLGSFSKVDEVVLFQIGGYTIFNEGEIGEINTEEGYTWRVGLVQCFSILVEVLGAGHEFAHRL